MADTPAKFSVIIDSPSADLEQKGEQIHVVIATANIDEALIERLGMLLPVEVYGLFRRVADSDLHRCEVVLGSVSYKLYKQPAGR